MSASSAIDSTARAQQAAGEFVSRALEARDVAQKRWDRAYDIRSSGATCDQGIWTELPKSDPATVEERACKAALERAESTLEAAMAAEGAAHTAFHHLWNEPATAPRDVTEEAKQRREARKSAIIPTTVWLAVEA